MQGKKLSGGFFKFFYFVIGAISLAVNIFLFKFDFDPNEHGWDFRVYSAAVRIYYSGGNPYAVNQLKEVSGSSLSFPYSPLSLPLLKFFVNFDAHFGYLVLYAIFHVLSFIIVIRSNIKNDIFYLIILFISGYWVFFLNMLTGNIELFSLLFFTVACYFYLKNKILGFDLAVGSLGILKMTPLLFGAIPIILFKKKSRIHAILIFAGVLLTLNFLAYFLFRETYIAWATQLIDVKAKQHSALGETIKGSGVSIFSMAQRFLPALIEYPGWFAGIIYIWFSSIIVITFFIFKRRTVDKNAVFFFGILAAMLIMPRLKDYSFVYALIPIYYLTKEISYKLKAAFLILCVILPAFSETGVVHKFMSLSSVFAILDYAHLISLICVYFFIIYIYKKNLLYIST